MSRQRQRPRGFGRLQSPIHTIGWGLLLMGIIALARIPYFFYHSQMTGHHLVNQAKKVLSKKSPSSSGWPANLKAVMNIPALGVTAPVVQGTQMSQLNIAIGHLTTSVNPGQPGTSILAAHNATWFRHINRLHNGNLVTVETPNTKWTFKVYNKKIVHTGTSVSNSSTPTLVLEACYPLNALYLTPYRYLVWAHLVKVSHPHNTSPSNLPPNTQYAAQGIPAAVKAQGLTLKTNYLPMGKLNIVGNASSAWRQSNAPLNAADITTTLFLAGLHVASAHQPSWWKQLAPNVPYANIESLTSGGKIVHYLSLANETEIVHKKTVLATHLTVTVNIGGGSHPGIYRIAATTKVTGQTMQLVGWTMSPRVG